MASLPALVVTRRRAVQHLSSSSSTRSASALGRRNLSLASDHYAASGPSSTSSKGPLLVLHGLYGSRQNWRSLAKAMAKQLERDVVTVDMRNHGESPHDPGASYGEMAQDVNEFVEREGWKDDVTLVGHSMGGKAAMATVLSAVVPFKRLVVVDISPERGPISKELASYVDAMREISKAGVKSRKEADTILQKWEKELSVRQFLLTNLVRSDETGLYSFRLPLDYLSDALSRGELGNFPYTPLEDGVKGEDCGHGVVKDQGTGRKWMGKTLFLKGAKSKYINRRNIPTIESMFPNSEVQTLDAGHWVHAEQPKAFVDSLAKFCSS